MYKPFSFSVSKHTNCIHRSCKLECSDSSLARSPAKEKALDLPGGRRGLRRIGGHLDKAASVAGDVRGGRASDNEVVEEGTHAGDGGR